MVKKKRTRITQSGKNCAINCAIQGTCMIWKQKIWLAICEFLWSLTNQNAWFFSYFCTELTLFCTVLKKTALLLTNQNREIFSCMYIDEDKITTEKDNGDDVLMLDLRRGKLCIVERSRFWTRFEWERVRWNPKDGEICPKKVEPEEILLEARRDSDVQNEPRIFCFFCGFSCC